MRSLIQQLRKHQPAGLHTIVVIGAGDGAGLPDLRTLNSRRMLLVEANPEQLKMLSRRAEPALGEEILPVAATDSGEASAKLFVYNNPRYSSLSHANELEKHFPNLRFTGEAEVHARPLPEILAEVSNVGDVGKLLILDAPGQSLGLVRSVPGEVLETFDWIIVSVADAALFDGDDAAGCLAALDAAGFDPVAEDTGSIAPERRILLQRNVLKVHGARLAAEQERYSGQIARLEIHHKAELDKITAELARQAEDHKAQLAKLVAERDRQAKLADERQAALDKIVAEVKQQIEGHKAQLAKLAEERDAALDQSAKRDREREECIAELERENAELGKRQSRLDQEVAKAEAQIDLIKDVWLQEGGS